MILNLNTLKKEFHIREKRTEILVVGGGCAGSAAAISSARNGGKVILVERYGFLGGTSTAAMVGPFMSSYSTDRKEQIIAGIYQEIINKLSNLGGAIDPSEIPPASPYNAYLPEGHANICPFDSNILQYVLQEMALEAGVDLCLHTRFVDTLVEENTVKGILTVDKNGFKVIYADRIIDATGDGDVSAYAGANFIKGRESDNKMQPASLFFRVANVDDEEIQEWQNNHPVRIHGRGMFSSLTIKAQKNGDFNIPKIGTSMYREPRPGIWRINASRILGVDGTDANSLTKAEIEGRRQVMEIMKFFKKYCPGFKEAYLMDIAPQVGIRETRHIIGEYILQVEDILEGKRFNDAIARGSHSIDIHNPEGTGGESIYLRELGINYFEIPYRCLVPLKIENLIVAGRCISATHRANAAARVMPPCFALGEAAGLAAVLSLNNNVSFRNVNIRKLRAMLDKQGAIV